MVLITAGYIQTAYPEEGEKAKYVAIQFNLLAMGAVIGGIIPVVIDRDSATTAGVPRAVYISYIVIMTCAGFLGLFLLPAHKLRRDDDSVVAADKARGRRQELKANLLIFTDYKLLLIMPAFIPAECFLVYSGAVNAYHNDLRACSLLSFTAILDNQTWGRRKRALIGLTVVTVPLTAAWIWDIIRVRNYTRHDPPPSPTDWSNSEFGWVFVLFMLTWISCSLWQYIITYFIGALINRPQKLAHYAGVFRGVLGAGEAVCFGLDSIDIPFVDEAGSIFAFYCVGIAAFYYLGWFHVSDSNYFKDGDEGTVVPNHVLRERGLEGKDASDLGDSGDIGVATKHLEKV